MRNAAQTTATLALAVYLGLKIVYSTQDTTSVVVGMAFGALLGIWGMTFISRPNF